MKDSDVTRFYLSAAWRFWATRRCAEKEAAGSLARDFRPDVSRFLLNQESWERKHAANGAGTCNTQGGASKQDINMVFAGDLLKPVHFEHAWSARNGHSALWAMGVLHDGANAHHGLHHGGMRGELRLRGDFFPTFAPGAAIPHAAGIR